MENKIWLSPPHMGNKEQGFINLAFNNNWLTSSGSNVDGFESDLETFFNSKRKVVSLNSGTSAIHMALIKAGVNSGDEVLCQSFTFCGSANPIKYLNAKPVFIDSEIETLNMCPVYLENAIKSRLASGITPKAIIVVHLYGMPAKMEAIMRVSKHYNIPLIEDAAEALGSIYKKELCGTLGHYGILSFNGNKVITTTSGGALLVRTNQIKEEIIHLASQARDNEIHYQHSKIGYNYRLSNVLAGIGRGQMQVLNSHLSNLQSNHQFYKSLFKNSVNLSLHDNPTKDYDSNFWLNIVFLNNPAQFSNLDVIKHLSSCNIESRPLWKPMHLQPAYKDDLFYGSNVAENLFNNGICLPSGSNLSNRDKERIASALSPYI